MVTIDDVGRRAGVSPATVSRVISNSGYVSERAKAVVLKAIDDLNLSQRDGEGAKDFNVRGLLALLVPEIVNSFYTTLARGAEDVANENGFHLILGNTDEKPEKEKIYVELMVASRVEGVLIASASRSEKPLKLLTDRSERRSTREESILSRSVSELNSRPNATSVRR